MNLAYELDKPNYNNRTYPSDVFEVAINKFLNEHPEGIPILLGNSEDIIGYATPCEVGSYEVEIIDTRVYPSFRRSTWIRSGM